MSRLRAASDGRPVEIVDEIPVDIDVIKFVGGDRVEDDVRRGVGGKAEEADAAFLLQFAGGGHAAVFPDGPIQQLAVVDAVQREQINVVQLADNSSISRSLQKFRRVRPAARPWSGR